MKRRVMAGWVALARPEGAVEPFGSRSWKVSVVVVWSCSEPLRPGARPLGRGSGLLEELKTGWEGGLPPF